MAKRGGSVSDSGKANDKTGASKNLLENPFNYQIIRIVEVIFGAIWLLDGLLKFSPNFLPYFPNLIPSVAATQPAYLQPWFSFWSQLIASNTLFFLYLVAALEFALAFSLITGFMRRVGYAGGVALSFLIWTVGEGFGWISSPGAANVGPGLLYMIIFFLLFLIINSFPYKRYSLDGFLRKRIKWWKYLS